MLPATTLCSNGSDTIVRPSAASLRVRRSFAVASRRAICVASNCWTVPVRV
jgi:hypothetical protein